ncbi:MAG: methionyl-tRNA formyltransferase [Bacilli bacterium]|nr:methionyl-tRNA formyltransferase [Bacilli bacterium]
MILKNLKVIFMGTPDFAVPILKELIDKTKVVLVVTQPDKLVGRKQILTPSPIKKLALEKKIPLFQPNKIREEFDTILNTDADIIITCAYGQIIPKSILDYPKLGCINVHASLLPKYRGGAPIHWCLINGDEKTGITIMYMAEKMDNGDIITQKDYKIEPSDNVGTLHEKLSEIGAQLLIQTLPSIINGTNQKIAQEESNVTYAYNIKREEERLDFKKTGKEVINQIRGLNPWPLANFLLENQEYKVLEARFLKKEHKEEIGKIIEITKQNFGITCQDGILYIEKIKPFGKKEMVIKDYLNGINKEEIINKVVNKED